MNNGIGNVWINEYVVLVQNNSPIKSKYILKDKYDIDEAIHNPTKVPLDNRTISEIISLLQQNDETEYRN